MYLYAKGYNVIDIKFILIRVISNVRAILESHRTIRFFK